MDDFFDRWAWLYAFCRERLFANHTELVARIMNERFTNVSKPIFIEVGCGPGFYAIAMAQRFSCWRVVGIDRSDRLLKRASRKAISKSIANCTFCHGDATCASAFPMQADFVVASRLLFILSDRLSALSAMHAGLRPGGTLLIAEPLPGWRSRVALCAMKVLRCLGPRHFRHTCSYPDSRALSEREFSLLVMRLDWARAENWSDHRYQYFLCEKPLAKELPNDPTTMAIPADLSSEREPRGTPSEALIAS
jgi:ubiquinone/menaquinone biosynthesis C-methylase UbiE